MLALNSGHTIGHITALYLIWLGNSELAFNKGVMMNYQNAIE
ncbi:Uncharacterised protein [Escherichia coli]|nr:hypothetical protein HmCmsJML039_00181 [Escherichia coli]GCV45833.1 hypothetical protein HmCmsJML033_04641 [Escherichia coli]STL09940.1 Uncharacterised protein [Escherichia coli]